MDRRCKHCGMESDQDRVCTWCGKPLEAPAPPPPPAPAALPGAGLHPASAAGPRPPPTPASAERGAAPRAKPKWPWILTTCALASLVLGIVLGVLVGRLACRPPADPEQWQQVASHTKELSLEIPTGWDLSTSGSPGTFEYVAVRWGRLYFVTIHGSAVKGSIGDIGGALARLGGGDGSLPVSERAEGTLHAVVAGAEQQKDRHYREQGEVQAGTFAGLPAACSEYTTVQRVGLMSVKMRGRRFSAPAGDYGYDVRAVCPAEHWAEFEPIAGRIIGSVQRGPG